jgi:hypothetical protein
MSIVHHQEVPIIYRRRNRIPALCLDIHTRTHIRLYYIMYYTLLYPVAIGEIDIYVCYFKFSPRPCSSLQSNLHQVWYNMVQHSDFDPVRFLPKWTQSYEVPCHVRVADTVPQNERQKAETRQQGQQMSLASSLPPKLLDATPGGQQKIGSCRPGKLSATQGRPAENVG